MKLKKLNEELEFLSSHGVKEVEAYILNYPLRKKSEEYLVENFPSLLTTYIARYGLCQKSAHMAIKLNDDEIIDLLLKTNPKEYNVESLFFDVGDYQTITRYLQTHDSEKYPEKNLFWYGQDKDIIKHIKKEKISEFGQYDLIQKKKVVALIEMIKHYRLSDKNKLILMLNGTKTVATELLKQIELSCPKNYHLLKQIYDVRFNHAQTFATASHKRMLKPAEELFFEIGDIFMVAEYQKRFNLPNAELSILNRKNRNGIITYLTTVKLSPEGENLLLKKGLFYEIIVYTYHNELSYEGEIKLIKRGVHNEIMYYLKHHSLVDEAQKALIKRGDHEEILKLVSTYPLADCAERVLFKRCDYDEIEAYFERKEASNQPL